MKPLEISCCTGHHYGSQVLQRIRTPDCFSLLAAYTTTFSTVTGRTQVLDFQSQSCLIHPSNEFKLYYVFRKWVLPLIFWRKPMSISISYIVSGILQITQTNNPSRFPMPGMQDFCQSVLQGGMISLYGVTYKHTYNFKHKL